MRQQRQQVVSVTTARRSHTDDIALRQRRYVTMQAARLVCIVLAVVVPAALPVKLVLFAGAVLLPWCGVVMANAGPAIDRRTGPALLEHGSLDEPVTRLALEPGRVVDGER